MSRLKLLVNGQEHELDSPPGTPLATLLRGELGLESVKDDFAVGMTGASTILIDDYAVIAVLVPADLAVGRSIVTAEGLADHPFAQELSRRSIADSPASAALLVSGVALLGANTRPTTDDVRRALAGVRAPSTSYRAFIEAVQDAARQILRAQEVR